jgi:PAS domain S-box-containing protein
MVTNGQPPNKDQIRYQLYECIDDTELSLKEKQRQVLEIGRRSLDVETAHIQHQIDDETHQVVTSVGNDTVATPEGVTLDRATTYCRRTIESHSPIALSNAPEEGWADDPAYEEHGWDCYLGATIFVDGDIYGTVCFVSETAQSVDFSADEKALVELIARLLGRAIEAAEYEQRLAETNRDKQRSEAKYETLLQLSPDAVVVADAETGHIETANDKVATLTGYTVDELREMSVIDLHPADDRDQYVELLTESSTTIITEQFEDGEPLYIECADGTTVPIEIGLSDIELDDRRLKLGIVRDISDRREREQKLKRQRAFLQQTQETVNLGGWELDFEGGFSQVTDETLRIFDLSLGDDITIEGICDCIHPDDQATLRDAFEQLRTSGEPFDMELRLKSDDDSRWVRMIGEPLGDDDTPSGARGIVRDISDRKARKRDLRVKDRAIEESSVGITIADANKGDLPIVYANRGFEQVTGYSQSEIFGRNCRFLQGNDTDEQTVAEIREAIEQEEIIQTEVLNYRANGTPFWNKLTIAPVMESETDDVTHFVGIQDDITAQKRRERLIEVLDRVLRHNLRNDMNVIEGFADVIARKTDGEVFEMARRIEETAT